MLRGLQFKKKQEPKSPLPKCACILDLNSFCREEEEAKKYIESILFFIEQNNYAKAAEMMNNKDIDKYMLLDNKTIIHSMKRFVQSEHLFIFTDNGQTTIRSEDIWESGKGIYVGKGDKYSLDKTKFNVLLI